MSKKDETIELPEGELTVADIVGEAGEAAYHTVLEIWRELLKGADQTEKEKISVQWSVKIIAQYSGLTFADMGAFAAMYYDRIRDLRKILDAEISSDDECLNYFDADEDKAGNGYHYINVLTDWQKQFLQWELDWDYASLNAAIEVAALSEVHKVFFGELGIVSLLDQINFEFTDEDREALATALRELTEEETGE